jgi:hypothetical protein
MSDAGYAAMNDAWVMITMRDSWNATWWIAWMSACLVILFSY